MQLFNTYSAILNFSTFLTIDEKDDIYLKVKDYLTIFEKEGISYGSSLVQIFKDNEMEIFGEFSKSY